MSPCIVPAQTVRRLPRRADLWVLVCAVASSTVNATAEAQPKDPLAFGPPPPIAAQIDPLLPTGALRSATARPRGMTRRCSAVAPVCVHHLPASQNSPSSLAATRPWLQAAETAYRRLVHTLQLPAPLLDGALGGTPALDLYITAPGSPSSFRAIAETRWLVEDRAAAHCQIAQDARPRARFATLCVAEALLLGVNAASATQFRRSVASYLSSLWTISTHELAEVDRMQANPQLGLIRRDLHPMGVNAWPLIAYWDQQLGTTPGALPVALLQQSRHRTPPGSAQWDNEPDALEVLRQALENEDAFGRFLLDFAVQRAFWGRGNAAAPPALAWTQDAGRVRFDWVLPSSSLPRRVAGLKPVQPMGSAYLWLQLDQRKPKANLAFRSEWEPPGRFRWALVVLDERGEPLRRFDLPYVRDATSAERIVPEVTGAHSLVMVGFNLGGVDRQHPFDPDHEPWEPHGYTVYLADIPTAESTAHRPPDPRPEEALSPADR